MSLERYSGAVAEHKTPRAVSSYKASKHLTHQAHSKKKRAKPGGIHEVELKLPPLSLLLADYLPGVN